MNGWSKLKKAAVISAVAIFGLAGISALTDNQKTNVSTPEKAPTTVTPPQVQSENTTQPNSIESAPQQTPEPAPAPQPSQPEATPSPPSNCDPNYSGGCVPIASDVDCGGGSGNGPAYFYGTATVIGSDIYGLDRDGDGLACE